MPAFPVRTGALFLLCAMQPACHPNEPTGDTPRPGAAGGRPATYVLRTVAGQPVPATLVANENVTITAVADTFRLATGSTGMQVSVQRTASPSTAQEGEVHRFETSLTYERRGDGIAISLECIDVVFRTCIAPPHYTGTFTASGLILLGTALNLRLPLAYERIP